VALIKSKSAGDVEGTWSMVYDQGLIVNFEEVRFISNFRYDMRDPNTEKQLRIADYIYFNSKCNATMVGWAKWLGEDNANDCFFAWKKGVDTDPVIKMNEINN